MNEGSENEKKKSSVSPAGYSGSRMTSLSEKISAAEVAELELKVY